ncbi:relaxase/mobilization nuclease domain-containing protein [Clostridioides difficile]|nr:relaxase/mobilization nuclease domain-containing protein [Clostridioides difficile]MDN9434833.1 relaxase/mobilization nuclease domain-containing protein [Clostridioides difficile]
MAVTKIKPVKSTLSKALDYIQNPDKTDGKMLVSSFGCSYETADIEFEYTLSQALQKGNNLAFHLIQSFEPGEVDYETAHKIGRQLADAVTKGQHEYVLTTHIDKGHVHNHIIFCAVNFVDHHKYNSNKRSYYGIRNMSDKLCREHGLSVVVPGKGSKGKSYAEYQAEKTGTSWKGKLKIAVDALIPQVSSFEELLQRLQTAGYEIKPGKYVSCRAPGQERFTRLKTLGADYTEEAIRERIAGKRARAAKAPRADRGGVSLLIDIENSIKAAQSKGYEQWAKIHNLKQAAKTMNFLTEHKIEQYANLTARIAEIQTESGQAADALKNVEKRLADMAVFIKNISTYQKTKPVYDAYRKAKNKEKYRAAHESDIILHEAAAKAMKAAGVSKLPNLAALQSEYEALQAQKETLYADYGKLKKQVREYDVIKQNIDSILRQDKEPERGKETERG